MWKLDSTSCRMGSVQFVAVSQIATLWFINTSWGCIWSHWAVERRAELGDSRDDFFIETKKSRCPSTETSEWSQMSVSLFLRVRSWRLFLFKRPSTFPGIRGSSKKMMFWAFFFLSFFFAFGLFGLRCPPKKIWADNFRPSCSFRFFFEKLKKILGLCGPDKWCHF